MDFVYDHIQEQALPSENQNQNKEQQPETTLNAEFQEAYKAISSSPWGAKLGGFFGSVVKQGESVYKEAQQELNAVSEEASKGFTSLQSSIISRTRGLSIVQDKEGETSGTTSKEGEPAAKDLSTDQALKESEGVLARLKSEAAKRLVEIQKAEDAADEALLKFGTNIRNFLKDAVSIAPAATTGEGQSNTVLFESKDSEGKRVIHTSRFDAQLHVIHSSVDSFIKDPISEEFEPWAKTFNVDSKTDDISKDLEKYAELRSSMEKLVPDKVKYGDFFKRYYFLRHSIETAEARRRDLLKGAAATEQEEVGWDEDSEEESSEEEDSEDEEASSDDEEASVKPKETKETKDSKDIPRPGSAESSTTIHPTTQERTATHLKPEETRKSHDEKSQADSDGSYDVVGAASGAPTRAPNSPKEAKKDAEEDESSEEEDWE
ncbi:hypothetical protein ACMFMG_006048 [Clarireedia jacksonii]